jgi:uncharacterized protein
MVCSIRTTIARMIQLWCILWLGLVAVDHDSGAGGAACAAELRPLSLLFLGDNGHHRPLERFAQLEPVFRERGISLKYTDDPHAALSAQSLGQFDGLIVYANIDELPADQEAALLDFVSAGHGFIPLHCASYCFRNSPRYIALVGAQFQRHGGEVFTVEPATETHPILDGYRSFRSWDETYIHTKHNPQDRVVLEYRVAGEQAEGQTREPWTWVRTHGKGRVFYTAWGHDERTWGEPGFQELVERGVRWACGDDPRQVRPYRARVPFVPLPMTAIADDAPPFASIDVGPKIPNYTPGQKWGTQGAAHSQMQLPLSPDDSREHYSVPAGFRLELFAAEPDLVGKPIAMNWDERGRLWICETVDYPNELQPNNAGRDRIRICEDTNHDGRADRFTVFAEQLSIPTAIAFARGGAVVQNGTETLFLKDSDGDDRADVREVLISNWALGDTHGGVSNFQYGLDNWLWAMQGYNNSSPEFAGQQLASPFRMGFFRFQITASQKPAPATAPIVSQLEFLRSSNNNTWGLGLSEEGLVFGSTANHNPSMFLPIPNRYYERVKGWSAEQLGTIAETHLFQAITNKIRQVDQFGGYTAGAGHALYTARTYPEPFWNRTAFVCEPTGHLVGTFVLEAHGSDFRSDSPMNLVASDDEWAAPIMAEVGPDGCVWILDWYNFIVQHNPTPIGFETGKGNAYETDLRDKRHGRVYRLVPEQPQRPVMSPEQTAGLSIDRPAQLVQALRRDNFLWRRHAQRLLVERGQTDVVADLLPLLADTTVDAIGLNTAAIHALWTLHGLGQIQPGQAEVMSAVAAALDHPSAGVRRNAIQVLPDASESVQLLAERRLTSDADAQVALAALLCLADQSPRAADASAVGDLIVTAGQLPRLRTDRWLKDALISASAMHAPAVFTAAAQHQQQRPMGDQRPLWEAVALRVGEHLGRSRPTADELAPLLDAVAAGDIAVGEAFLTGVTNGWPADHQAALSRAQQQMAISAWMVHGSLRSRTALLRMQQAWQLEGIAEFAVQLTEQLLEQIAAKDTQETERAASLETLFALQSESTELVDRLLDLITPQTPPEQATAIVAGLAVSRASNVGPALVDRARSWTPSLRRQAIRVLLSRPQTASDLIQAMETGTVQLAELSLDQQQALSMHPDAAVKERASRLLASKGGLPSPDRVRVLQDWLPVAEVDGDIALGQTVFQKQCSKCHQFRGEGQKIGPDLTGMELHPRRELLGHILDPSRSVEGNYRLYTVVLQSGQVLTGMLAGESQTAIELIDTEAKRHTVVRDDLDELVGSTKSLMPEGFEKQITRDEMAHLLTFLTQRGRYTPVDLRAVASVVTTRGMFFDPRGDAERLIFSDWGPKVFNDVPFQLIDPADARVPNAILFYGPLGTLPPQMPKQVELPCNMPVKAIHLLSGVSGWGFPLGQRGSVSLTVKLHYADGSVEQHDLLNGIHFADYIREVDVPESKLAFRLRGQQLRYLAVLPQRTDRIERIELVKGPDDTAPVVMAVTLEALQ